jgi:hypothetical protein
MPLSGFANRNEHPTNEYLSINVYYKTYTKVLNDKDAQYQLFYIQEQSKDIKKIAVAVDKNWPSLEKKLIKEGFEISKEKVKSIEDNAYIFNLINTYEELGWKLHSHSTSRSYGMGESVNYKEDAAQYLLYKQKD